MSLAFVYVTCSSLDEARNIGIKLVEERLAACVNVFPVNSIYLWEGKVKGALEFALIVKTTESKFEELKKRIKELHSYQNPCIALLRVEATEEFENWIKSVVK